MQGVHVTAAINDENSIRGPLLHTAFKENPASALQAPSKQGSTLKSARKAFGNITNRCSDAATQQQPAGTVVKRRAFGDITNSSIKQQPGEASTKKADPLSSQLKPSSTQVATAEARVTAPWWETAPPERSAGKTWEQLLADKEQQEDADVESSVQQLLAGFRDLTVRCFQVQPDDSSEEDELQPPGPPPPELPSYSSSSSSSSDNPTKPSNTSSMQQATASAGFPFGLHSSSGSITDLLPDVELSCADLADEAAAAAALPHMEQALPATFPAATCCSASGNSSWTAADSSGRERAMAQQQVLQHAVGELTCSPVRPAGGASAAVAGLKSPEVLPW